MGSFTTFMEARHGGIRVGINILDDGVAALKVGILGYDNVTIFLDNVDEVERLAHHILAIVEDNERNGEV